MKTSNLSFLSQAERLTYIAYENPRKYSVIVSEVISRVAATLLSPAAALDVALHGLMILPTCVYAIGKSIYCRKINFTLPWQHLQRVQNAISPLLLGSAFGILHPFAGLGMSESTDKHAMLGMLSSNTNQKFETPCSPIYSLSTVERIAKQYRYVEVEGVKKEIFSKEHVQLLRDTKNFERTLESLQAQEFIHKITNVTLVVMAKLYLSINASYLNKPTKEILIRLSGFLIPVLTSVDIAITLFAQALFLATGVIRLISGRGPIYTEVTTNPLMHVSFLIQNILKTVGNLIGTAVWIAFPMIGFKVSLIPANLFFKLQLNMLMLKIMLKMFFAKNDSRFAIPIVFGNGECSALSFPTHSMHKTYLIVEKTNGLFNLYWVNRPYITHKSNLNIRSALKQIRPMLDERFPFMNIEKLMNYPVKSESPKFQGDNFGNLKEQGNTTNCVVSNMFGMLEALDQIKKEEAGTTQQRYAVVRQALMNDYGFYKYDFSPFAESTNWYSLSRFWNNIEYHSHDPI